MQWLTTKEPVQWLLWVHVVFCGDKMLYVVLTIFFELCKKFKVFAVAAWVYRICRLSCQFVEERYPGTPQRAGFVYDIAWLRSLTDADTEEL